MKVLEVIAELQKFNDDAECTIILIDHDDYFHSAPIYDIFQERDRIVIDGIPPTEHHKLDA